MHGQRLTLSPHLQTLERKVGAVVCRRGAGSGLTDPRISPPLVTFDVRVCDPEKSPRTASETGTWPVAGWVGVRDCRWKLGWCRWCDAMRCEAGLTEGLHAAPNERNLRVEANAHEMALEKGACGILESKSAG